MAIKQNIKLNIGELKYICVENLNQIFSGHLTNYKLYVENDEHRITIHIKDHLEHLDTRYTCKIINNELYTCCNC